MILLSLVRMSARKMRFTGTRSSKHRKKRKLTSRLNTTHTCFYIRVLLLQKTNKQVLNRLLLGGKTCNMLHMNPAFECESMSRTQGWFLDNYDAFEVGERAVKGWINFSRILAEVFLGHDLCLWPISEDLQNPRMRMNVLQMAVRFCKQLSQSFTKLKKNKHVPAVGNVTWVQD